jgi:hypothetical protein
MRLNNARQILAPYFRSWGGWRTRRNLLVVESDDWGSIRMPSRAVYERCLKAGYPVDQTWFERYDSLLSEVDLELLFGLLTSFKDSRGRHPVITANVIVANPDFDAIEATGRHEYHYEAITETFKRYPKHVRCLDLWAQGRRQGIFFPQFHGREHLNVGLFMEALQKGDPVAQFAFEHRMPGCIPKGPRRRPNRFVAATRFRSADEKEAVRRAQLEGLQLFETLFGFRSRTLIPTNYVWSSDFNRDVFEAGVEGFQGAPVMKEQQTDGSSVPVKRVLGERNELGQMYLMRNATFEPSQGREPRMRSVDRCLHEIRTAFQMQKPAVISSHRINFCGFIDETNRDQNLEALRVLLATVLRKWSEVEFVTSEELLDIVNGG